MRVIKLITPLSVVCTWSFADLFLMVPMVYQIQSAQKFDAGLSCYTPGAYSNGKRSPLR
jgi:hypothetical protein